MFKKLKNTLVISCVFYFILGIVMLLFPSMISDSVCYLVALLFLFFGVAAIVTYVRAEVKTPYVVSTLILGIILGAFGIYVFLNPRVFVSFIPLVTGIFLIADSVSKLSASFDLKKYGYNQWWHMLIIAFVVLGFGILLLFNPFKAVELTIMIIGGILIVDAITNIITIYSFSKVEKTMTTPGLIGDIVVNEETK